MGGIHPSVSSRKEAGQPSTQPSVPGGSSCGGSSGSPPTLLSGMASPQVGKLRPSRSQGPQFLPTASSAALPARIGQPGPLLWAPPLGALPSVTLNQRHTVRPLAVLSSPLRTPAEDLRAPGLPPGHLRSPRRATWAAAGDGARPQGCGVAGGAAFLKVGSRGQGRGALSQPPTLAGQSCSSLCTHVSIWSCISRPCSLMTILSLRGPRERPGPHRALPTHGSSPGQAGWGSVSPLQRTSHPATFWHPG